MPISKQRKEELVAQYTELLKDCVGVIITENRGMTVAQFNQIRAKMREIGSTYVVTKNTLLRQALENVGMVAPEELLRGPVVTAFVHTDLAKTAQVVLDFRKEAELFAVKGAVLGESRYDANGVEALSKLPSLGEIRGQLVGVIIAPLTQLAGLVGAPASELVSVINGGATQVLNVIAAYVAKEKAA